MKLFNFQRPKEKSDFGTYFGRTVFHLLIKLVGNQYPEFLRILVVPEILDFNYCRIWEDLMFNWTILQIPYIKWYWHLWNLLGNQYLEVLRILVSLRFYFPQQFLHNLRGTAYVQLNNFPDPIQRKDFDIYVPATICSFPKTLAENNYISVWSWNISSLWHISCLLHFLKNCGNTA